MTWRSLWKGAKLIAEERLADRIPSPPADRLDWTAFAWVVTCFVGIPVIASYCH
jgi:hypothetical protein